MKTKITDMKVIRQNDSLLLARAKELVLLHKLGSVQMLQRHFGISYKKAAELMEKLKKSNKIREAISYGSILC